MAKMKGKKTPAAAVPGAPDPAVVQQVKDGMLAQLAATPPAGTQAALFDGKNAAKLKKLIGGLAPEIVKIALAGADGTFTPAEIAELINDGVNFAKKWLAKDAGDAAPAPATSPPPPEPRVA